MKRRTLTGPLILALAVVLGALRDFLFVNLNYQIDAVAHGRPVSYAHSAFQAVTTGFELPTLLAWKWVLAVVFVLLMLTAGIALSRVLFGDHRYRMPILIGTAIITLAAFVCHALAASFSALEAVSVALSHAIQYPVPLLFIYAASWRKAMGARPAG